MNTTPLTEVNKNFTCPKCGDKGKPVKPVTLQSLLRQNALARVGAGPYHFCTSPECDIVYFGGPGIAPLTKADLTVRVGIKETSALRHVCYCFNHTIEEIEDELRRTGQTTVLDDIKTRMKEACWCETKSPLGSCCLATVTKYVKAAGARHGKSEGFVAVAEDTEDCCAAHNPGALATTATRMPSATARVSKGEKVAWVGSIASAVVASACCWLPLLLLAFGVSGVAVSATFEKYRPLFAALTFGFLAAAFYFAYRPRLKMASASACTGDVCSATPASGGDCCPLEKAGKWTLQKVNRAMLWAVTAVALAFVFFPNYISTFLGGREGAEFGPNLEQYVVSVDGMDCAACAVTLENQLKTVPGVGAAKVTFEKMEAIIGVPKGSVAPKEAVLAAVASSGFTGRFESLETRTIPIAGMTCEACAAPVQASLAKVPGVRSAKVSYADQQAVVLTDAGVATDALAGTIEAAGYQVADPNQNAKP